MRQGWDGGRRRDPASPHRPGLGHPCWTLWPHSLLPLLSPPIAPRLHEGQDHSPQHGLGAVLMTYCCLTTYPKLEAETAV